MRITNSLLLFNHFMKFSPAIIKLFISIFLFSTAFGMNVVIFPAKLLENGITSAQIGFASAFEVVGGVIMSLYLGRLIKKIGVTKSLFFSSALYAVMIFLIFFCKIFYFWLLLVLIMGSCWVINVIARQAWLHTIISDKNRGMMAGIYSMLISIGLALGPLLVKYFGASGYSSFIISASIIFAAFLIIKNLSSTAKLEINSSKIPFRDFFKKNPRCFLGRFFFDFISFSILGFSVVFGRKLGFSAEDSGLLITAFMASFIFDVITGILLKKYNAYKLINIGFIGFLICISIIAIYHHNYKLLLALFFIMGIFAAFIYVSIMTAVNNDYDKEDLIAANSTMQVIGSSGSLAAGLINGFLITIFSASGFIITIALSCIIYLTFLVFYEKKYHPSWR